MVVSVPRQAGVQVTTLIMTVPPLVKNDSDSGAEKADLSSWDWEDLSSDESNSSSKTSLEDKTSSSSFKADELKNGNYKSAVGTWKSSNGMTIKITSDGQLELWGNAYPIDKVSQSQYVSGIYSLTYIDSIPTGNTPQLSFVLKGLAMEVMLEITVRTEF